MSVVLGDVIWHNAAMPNLDAIGLVVAHMGDAMDFYRKLGLQFTMGTEADGHVEASGPGGLRIMFDTEEMVQVVLVLGGAHREATGPRWHSCARVRPRSTGFISNSRQAGPLPCGTLRCPWGQRYATVLDPSGNAVDLFAPTRMNRAR